MNKQQKTAFGIKNNAQVQPDEAMVLKSEGILVDIDMGLKNDIERMDITSPEERLDYGEREIKVAILSEDGFEEVALTSPKQALEDAGIKVDVVAPHSGKIKGWKEKNWGKEITVDKLLKNANAGDYDAIVLPGGVMNPDKLRQNKDAILFISQFILAGKTVAAICHGPQTLTETGMIAGKTMTSYPSIQTDLRNAGVIWVDEEMVYYGQFITSRRPADLEAFNAELIDALSLHA